MRSLALTAYLGFASRASVLGRSILKRRLDRGKEDADRLGERRGEPSQPRPAGRLIWFHAASVGESLSLLELIRRLVERDADLRILVTTGTVTSARLLEDRLPAGCIHQYVPLDMTAYVRAFLDHWRPDLAVWTESELWPSLILETHARSVPLLLLNARMSERSARRWRKLGGAIGEVLSAFDAVQVQDDVSAAHLRQLGLDPSKLAVTGTLKEGAPPPDCDETELTHLTAALNGRPVWLAASTHKGEEAAAIAAHQAVAAKRNGLMMILAPRHPERGDEIAAQILDAGLTVRRRRLGERPQAGCDVYLADTLGEMGLWYRLAPVSFLGGSLLPIGGHNPFEPASLGSVILHGPHVANFHDIYARLDAAHAAAPITDAETLASGLDQLLEPTTSAPMAYAAWELASSGAAVTDTALALITDHLPEHAA